MSRGSSQVHLWNVGDPARPVALGAAPRQATGSVQSLAFRRDGRMLAAADSGNGASGAVLLWNVGEGPGVSASAAFAPIVLASRQNAVAFSPDGTTLAAGGNDGTVRRWDTSGARLRETGAEMTGAVNAWVNGIAFDATGAYMAVAGADENARIWDVHKRQVMETLPHPQPVEAVSFQPGDDALLTNSIGGVARVWAMPGRVLAGADGTVTTVAYVPDRPDAPGRGLLAAAGSDLRLWNVSDLDHPVAAGPAFSAATGDQRMDGTVAISPDGRMLAAGIHEDREGVALWDIADPSHPVLLGAALSGPRREIQALAFSPDGRTLAAASDDGAVYLWGLGDPDHPRPLPTLKPGLGQVFMVAFSRGGLLAAAGEDGAVAVWDVRHPQQAVPLGTLSAAAAGVQIYSVAFNAAGTLLAAGDANGVVHLWNAAGPGRPTPFGAPLSGPDGRVFALTFSPDGGTLTAGTGVGQIWQWDVSGSGPPRLTVAMNTSQELWTLRYAPGGQTMAGAANVDVQLWDTDPAITAQRICRAGGDVITKAEWAKYIPDIGYRKICPE